MPFSKTLLSNDELQILTSSLPPNEISIWFYWDEFQKRYSRLGRSLSTISNVRDSLRWLILKLDFYTFEQCSNFRDLEDKFYEYKEERGIANSTLNSYRKNLITYFKLLERYKFIPENPIQRIPKAKENYQGKLVIQEHHIAKIVHAVGTRRSTRFERARNIFVIDLLRYTGARPCEIASLKWKDIRKTKDGYEIKIQGAKQNRKPRIYRLRSFVRDSFENYINVIPEDRKLEPHLLLSRKHNKAFGLKGFRYLFRKLKDELGLNITAYGFRRYVATKLKKEGFTLEKIGDYLGHTRTSTTRKYLEDLPDWTDEAAEVLSGKTLDLYVKNHVIGRKRK